MRQDVHVRHDEVCAMFVSNFAANGHDEVLQLLLSHDKSRDALYIRDVHGSSALHDAAEQGETRCLQVLVEAGGLAHQANDVST